jgi:regulator of cell morphogenesis and NO signaling
MNLTSESRVGEIATQHPLATRVFARHGIDFCCGGGVALAHACAKRQLDTAAVLEEIERAIAAPGTEETRWDERPLADLVRHIVEQFHAPLREELPRLESMARKVFRVHGDKDPARLAALLESFLALKGELDEHMHLEEERLFPAILAHATASSPVPAAPLAKFVDDHSRVGAELARLRELTDDFRVPEEACNTWSALWHGLGALEADLHEHIHLENNVLFPRAAAA